MKKKLVAQYCCVALVAAGIGLNVQNAIADYGMNGDVISLVASGETGSLPCSSEPNLVATCTHSNAQQISKLIRLCGKKAGIWMTIGCVASNGLEIIHDIMQQTYQVNEKKEKYLNTEKIDNQEVRYYHCWEVCEEKEGKGISDCNVPNAITNERVEARITIIEL